MKQETFKRKVNLFKPAFFLTVLLAQLFAAKLNDNVGFLTYMWSAIATLYLTTSMFNNVYLPLISRIVVDPLNIRLDAGRFSWSYPLSEIYIKKEMWGLFQSLYLTEQGVTKKVMLDYDSWRSVDNNAVSLDSVLTCNTDIKPYSEIPNRPQEFGDYEPVIKRVLYFLLVAFIVLIIAAGLVHRYYIYGEGTPEFLYLIVSLPITFGVFLYLNKHNSGGESNVATVILTLVISLFLVPVLYKGYAIVLNDVETHRFELVKKNGGYQHWRSLEDGATEFKLGSVNNKIQTENDQGAVVVLKLIKSSYLTLYLPNQIEITRYKVNAINEQLNQY